MNIVELFSWKTTSHKDHLEVCLSNSKLLSGFIVGVPLQGNGKFDRGAYYVVGRLHKLIVLSAIINNYLVFNENYSRLQKKQC